MSDLIKDVARVIDPAPFGRQDINWRGEGSSLWEHYYITDVRRIKTAMNRTKAVLRAIREPTNSMVRAMSKPLHRLKLKQGFECDWVSNQSKHRIRWRAGVDDALGSVSQGK